MKTNSEKLVFETSCQWFSHDNVIFAVVYGCPFAYENIDWLMLGKWKS